VIKRHIHDLHATTLHLIGIDHKNLTEIETLSEQWGDIPTSEKVSVLCCSEGTGV